MSQVGQHERALNTQPLVSIVLPTLNGGRYIATSLESCLRQTYDHFELIVVDGGSTDGTLDVVRSFADPRIRIVNQANNAGRLPGALNEGFAHARGTLFTWTQDDDYYTPDALATMVAALQADSEVGFVYAGFWFIDAAGQVLRPAEIRPPEELYWRNAVGHCFLYRRTVADQVGGYALDYVMSEDSQYWVRVYRVAKMKQLPGNYFYHRLQPDNLTGRNFGAYASLRVAARARREVLRISWFEYQRQLGDADIEEAFAAHAKHAPDRVRRCVFKGVLRNPRWLANRGVVAIGLRAWLAYAQRGPQDKA
jgi:glycosyltransferase involved in cell wall biosynthesis